MHNLLGVVRVGSHACYVKGQPFAHRVCHAPAATSPPWVPHWVSFSTCLLALVTCLTPWLLRVCQLKWRKSRPSCRCSDLRLSSNAPPVRSYGRSSRSGSSGPPLARTEGPQSLPSGLGSPVASCQEVVSALLLCSEGRGLDRTLGAVGHNIPLGAGGRWGSVRHLHPSCAVPL